MDSHHTRNTSSIQNKHVCFRVKTYFLLPEGEVSLDMPGFDILDRLRQVVSVRVVRRSHSPFPDEYGQWPQFGDLLME